MSHVAPEISVVDHHFSATYLEGERWPLTLSHLQHEQQYAYRYFNRVYDEYLDAASFPAPQVVVDRKRAEMIDAENRLVDLDNALAFRGVSPF